MPSPDVSRRAALAIGALAVLASQAAYLPERLAYWRDAAAFARTSPDERSRRAFLPASRDLLLRLKAEIPRDAALLLVTPDERPRGGASYVLFHRALYELYPRRVFWACPGGARGYPEWWARVPLDADAVLAEARRVGATAVLLHGVDLPIRGRAVAVGPADRLVYPEPR